MKFKKNIEGLNNVQETLFKINPRSYNYRVDEFPNKKMDNELHFGFIAQEVAKLYPNLSHKDEKGNYAVNYIEFIPLLLQALKEEDQKVAALKDELNQMKVKLAAIEKSTSIGPTPGGVKNVLEQNIPNPFNGSTTIKFTIGQSYNRAFIGVYDMNGKQVKQVPVENGANQVVLEKGALNAGIYMYSLVVDNDITDTKRMIVSE